MIIGIDPGLTGALALVVEGSLAEVLDMPVASLRGKNQIARGLVAAQLRVWRDEYPRIAVAVEDVHAMPKQGVASTFSFGRAFGAVEGICSGLGLAVMHVQPKRWKRTFNLGSDKEGSRLRAIDYWPDKASLFSLKRHEGRAEAALIGLYGWNVLKGEVL